MNILLSQFLLGIMFLTLVFLHLTKKNTLSVAAYAIQSAMIAVVLFNSFWENDNKLILLIVLLTLAIKVISAPIFFNRFIKKYNLSFSVSTYLNTPLTLTTIAILTFIAHSKTFISLTGMVPSHQALLSLSLSLIFISLFLIINRKGAISQVLGILSLENSILAFVVFAGLEQSPSLQVGVIFNIFVWIVISTLFMSMIYKHFGSQDVTSMKKLKD